MIPRIVHQFWTGGPIPDRLADYMATWRIPGWEYRLWGDLDLDWLANQAFYDDAAIHAPGSEGQFRSDIARYEILHRFGGVYVDADFERLGTIDDLCDVDFWTAWEADRRWANMAIAGSIPGHPLLAELIDGLGANVERYAGRRPNFLTGPRYLTPILRRYDVVVRPSAEFYPYAWNELDRIGEEFPDARAVHHWHNQRTNPTLKKRTP